MKSLTGKGKPFHSALDKAAALLKRKVGTGAEFMKELQGLGGIKQAEIDERKLGEVMGMPRMTHDQFMAALAAKPAPAIREKVFKNPSTDEVNAALEKQIRKNIIREYKDEGYTAKQIEEVLPESLEDALNSPFAKQAWMGHYEKLNKNPTHHDKYTLPGGENYREMLIKAPKGGEEFGGVGAHFKGEPGILASMRLKDRTGPNGEKLLHLEELQSDWHQQGREKGYKADYESQDEMMRKRDDLYDSRTALVKQALAIEKAGGTAPQELIDQIHGMNDQLRTIEERKDKARNAVPDAPFKKNWEEMALKRLMHHAAEKGYHGLVVTPGNVQADRYSLAKHIDSLSYEKKNDKYHLRYVPKGGGTFESLAAGVAPEDLASHVGKEMAEKIINKEGNRAGSTGIYTFPNVDLQVGGEGMKGFYDKKVPNILNAIGKKYGIKTHLHGHPLHDIPKLPEEHEPEDVESHAKMAATPLHHFPITEPMRQDILKNGLPLYKEGGTIHKAIGGTVQPSVNQMRTALMQNKFAVPASDIKSIGAQEAPDLGTKVYVNEGGQNGMGGVDVDATQPGMQLMQAQPNLDPTKNQPQQGGQPSSAGLSSPAQQPPSNILQMTRQGQAMNAMTPPQPQGMAKGGRMTVKQMKHELQGYASKGYVHHTDINPHPEAGKRFVNEQLPGLMPERPVNMDELYNERASLQLRPWDSTSRHVKVTNVSGHELTNPLITEGGQGFARDIELNKKGISGASGREIQKRIQSRANAAHEENIKQGGRGHTYDIIANMESMAPLFTHMPLHVQLDFLKQANLSPKEIQHIEDRIRRKKVQGKTPFANMLPLEHPETQKQLNESGALRKAVSTELASKTNQKRLDYNLEDLLAAVTDPHIHAAPAGYAGNTFIANVPHAGLGPQHHTVYDTSGYGEYAGKGAQVPAELYMADAFERISHELQKQYPNAGASAIRAMTIGALQTRGGNVSQMVNDRVMRNLERYHEGIKAGDIQNPNDLYGVLGHFYKKYGGYKKGGKVKDNLDTMRLALTKNSKKKSS